MAQRQETGGAWAERVRAMMRQRRGLVALAAAGAVALVLAAAAGSGLAATKTLTIERGAVADAPSESDELSMGSGDDVLASADAAEAADVDVSATDDASAVPIVVDVSGAVVAPAVVSLAAGARVQDAIDAAGGLTADADLTAINRAAPLVDGQKVQVPRIGEAAQLETGVDASAGTAAASGAGTALVNINTADEAALDELPGIGPATAQAIIEDREAKGPFTVAEDLMRVSGIGEKKFEQLQDLICV